MNSSGIEQGDLVVADILFAEQTGSKRRLAVAISSTEFNQKSEDIVVLKVTSQQHGKPFEIPLTNEHTIKKMLKKNSIVTVGFPVTLAKEKIAAVPDKLKKEKLLEIKQAMKKLYEL